MVNSTRVFRWCLSLALMAGVSAQAQNFVVGNGGVLLRTTDRGQHWKSQRTGHSFNMYGLWQLNKDTLLTVGELSRMFLTNNGGATPPQVIFGNGANNHDFSEVGFYSRTRGEVYSRDFRGTAANAFRTTDRGQNWQDIGFGNGQYAYGFQVFDSLNAVRLASNTVQRTTNSGASWNNVFAPEVYRSVANVDSTVVLVGEGGVSYRSTNLGRTWQRQNLNTTQTLNHVRFSPNKKTWLITGNNGVLRRSNDTGRTWMPMTLAPQNPSIFDIAWIDSARALVVTGPINGIQGVFLSTDTGATFTRLDPALFPNANNTWMITAKFLNKNFGIIASQDDRNRMYKTTNGGTSWTQIITTSMNGGNRNIHAIGIFSPDTFMVGYNGGYGAYQLFRTVDGGQSFTEIITRVGSNSANDLRSEIQVIDNRTAYLTGGGGRVWKTTDAGATWTATQVDANGTFLNDINNGWLVGDNGTVYSTTDFVTYTQSFPLGYKLGSLRRLYAVDPDTMFLAGFNGLVLKSTNGGSQWNYVGVPSVTNNLNAIAFGKKGQNGVAVGAQGTVLNTTNGGRTWNLRRPTSVMLNDVAFLDSVNVLVVGNGGTMFRSSDGGVTWTSIYTNTTQDLNRISFRDTLNQLHTADPVAIRADTVRGFRAANVTVPVRLRMTAPLMGLQTTITWDTAVATFASVTPVITGLTTANFDNSQAAAGRIAFSWARQRTQGVASTTDTTLVLRLVLTVRGRVGDSTLVNFASSIRAMGAADTTGLTRDLIGTAGIVRVIGNPALAAGNPANTTICAGRTVRLPYTVTGAPFLAGNVFTAQLSDASGSFATPVNVGTRTATMTDSITVTIPANTTPGSGYRIRVSASAPAVIGDSTLLAITVAPVPAAPAITASRATALCAGDSVVLRAPAGFASYLWSNGATTDSIVVRTVGNFNVRVTSAAGCQSVASANTSVTNAPTPAATTITVTGTTTICGGDSVTLTAANTTGPWLWSTGATTRAIIVKTAGAYRVQYRNAQGCLSAQSNATTITVTPRPAAPVLVPGGGDTLRIANPVVGATYSWFRGTTQITPTGATFTRATVAGNYYVRVRLNGCTSDTSNNIITSLAVRLTKVGVRLYPNPAHQQATMQFDGLNKPAVLTLTDALGRAIRNYDLNAGTTEHQVEVAGLPTGMYLLQLQTEDGVQVHRLRVE